MPTYGRVQQCMGMRIMIVFAAGEKGKFHRYKNRMEAARHGHPSIHMLIHVCLARVECAAPLDSICPHIGASNNVWVCV